MTAQHAPDGREGVTGSSDSPIDAAGLHRQVSDLQHRLETTEDRWQRSAADLENLRKRFDREMARGQKAERERALLLLVGLVDDLGRAVVTTPESMKLANDGCAGLLAGVESIVNHGVDSLAKLGYPRFGVVGEPFDPLIHEALGTLAPPPSGRGADATVTIAEVVKPGYGNAEQLLRPATVLVTGGVRQ